MGLRNSFREFIGLRPVGSVRETSILDDVTEAARSFSANARDLAARFEASEAFFARALGAHKAEPGASAWWAFDLVEEAIVVLDERATILVANAATARILGRRSEDLVGTNMHSLVDIANGDTKPEDAFKSVLETGKPAVFRAARRDGIFPLELTMAKVSLGDGINTAIAFLRDASEAASYEAITQHLAMPETGANVEINDFCQLLAKGLSASMTAALVVRPDGTAVAHGGWRLEPHPEFGMGPMPAPLVGQASYEAVEAAATGRIVRRVQRRPVEPILLGVDANAGIAGIATAAFAPADIHGTDGRLVLVVGWEGVGPLRWLHIAEDSMVAAANHLAREVSAKTELPAASATG